MRATTTALRFVFETLHRSGAAASLRPWSQGLGVIFCMHRVQPEEGAADGFAPNSGLSSTPAFLDAALTMLRESGYDLVSLDEAHLRITGQASGKPFAAFTLDDGYRDNLIHAVPVFMRHECPFTIYAAPGFVDATTELWWLVLERLIDRGKGALEASGTTLMLDGSAAAKWRAWQNIGAIVYAMEEHTQRQWIREKAARFGVDIAQMCRDLIMSWDELRQLTENPLATIGAHTLNHFAMSKLPEAEARHEIAESGARLHRELGKPVRHFAFPYGNCAHAGPRDFRLAAESGYATAVTTRIGAVYAEHAAHLHGLPRIMVSSKYAEARWLKVLASGLPGRMRNFGRRLNVA